jgi:capsular polysaccharide biosynthesis protein
VEIDEVVARLFRRYWEVVLLCVAIPVAAVALITVRQPLMYSADARIIAGSVVPGSSAESAGIVSQIQGVATGRDAVTTAFSKAHVRRNLNDFIANDISVSGLGSSQVVDLTVTDRNRRVAAQLANTLASEVVTSLNHVGQSGLTAALKAIDGELVKLSQRRAVLAQQVIRDPNNQQLQAKLAGLEEVISNFTGDRGRLLIQAGTQGLAAVIDPPALPAAPQSTALPQKLGLAGLLGLIAGILIASIIETVRPTVPGARWVGRRLGAPLFGDLRSRGGSWEGAPGLDAMALRIRLAAMHAGVSTVALADIGTGENLAGLAAALEQAMSAGSVGGAAAGNSHGPTEAERAASGASLAGTLVRTHDPAVTRPALRIVPLSQMTAAAAADWGHVGLLVLSGASARAADVTALGDLAAASGWPVLGVARVRWTRHQGRPRPAERQAAAGQPASPSANGAAAGQHTEGRTS